MKSDDFLPTASVETLKIRSIIMRELREFFHSRLYIEVETPLLSNETVVDAHLDPYRISDKETDGKALFLQTSPEACMKRLLAAGSPNIYQITKSFRKGEAGNLHNPEFTILEWYGLGEKPEDQMKWIEEMIHHLVSRCPSETDPDLSKPFEKISYNDAFFKYSDLKITELSLEEIIEQSLEKNVPFPKSPDLNSLREEDRDLVLNVILSELIEPKLGQDRPVFVYDYPASQAALAKIKDDDPTVAERFELYYRGIEICNGYHELLDAEELVERTNLENRKRKALSSGELPAPNRLIESMRSGLPACTGVALGLDRLLMLLLKKSSVREVISFPQDIA